MTFNNIPLEVRSFPQWVVWRLEESVEGKPTKLPYNPRTGKFASVTDPTTWATFDEVIAVMQTGWYSGIGFVLTDNDPYSFIDLDNPAKEKDPATALARQLDIFHKFDSYSERSPSGNGLHIIVKGAITGGRRRSSIEVYSSERYMTMTGDIFDHKDQINERQELLSLLWSEMGGTASTQIYTGNDPEFETDQKIIERACAAVNGDKFTKLLRGEWQDLYGSQSEADFAFIDILAFYTHNRAQIVRMFRASPLGQRDKAKRNDYVTFRVNKSFDRLLPPIDFDGLFNQLTLRIAEKKAATETAAQVFQGGNAEAAQPLLPGIGGTVNASHMDKVPPGLLGEIASFIYATSARQVPEIALATAIGLMAGICGKAYNVSGTGVNQYILLLAATGTGKEGMSSGIEKLMNGIRLAVPASGSFIGPAQIASGQALLKYISKTSSCFVSILGEFGATIQQLSSHNANPSQVMLLAVLRDLYHKSDHGAVLRPSIYSQKDNNTDVVLSPALSLLCETNPEEFYSNIDESMISSGLLPRFTIIEYNGHVVELNENRLSVPPMTLVEQLAQLAAQAHTNMHGQKVCNVGMTDETKKISKELGRFCDKQINEASVEVIRHLWNRVHIKTLRLAAVVAIGKNIYNPIIDVEDFEWAQSLVISSAWAMLRKFERGEIGKDNAESRQGEEVVRIIQEYLTKPFEHAYAYGAPRVMFDMKIIPFAYIQRRLVAAAAFRLDRYGATNAIKRAVQTLIDTDVLREIGKQDLATKYNTTMRGFVVSNPKAIFGDE